MERITNNCPCCGGNELVAVKPGVVKCSYCDSMFRLKNYEMLPQTYVSERTLEIAKAKAEKDEKDMQAILDVMDKANEIARSWRSVFGLQEEAKEAKKEVKFSLIFGAIAFVVGLVLLLFVNIHFFFGGILIGASLCAFIHANEYKIEGEEIADEIEKLKEKIEKLKNE